MTDFEAPDFDAIDFFRDTAFVADPYPYFEHLREQCPVQREPHHDVVMVTGYEEAISVYHDTATFSSCNSVTGPFPGFPVPLVGDDVSALIEQHRDELPMSDQLPTLDPPTHTAHRALLMRLITPKRLRENEAFMWRLADRQIDEFVANGECEFISEFASPFALLVIADLLGVPEADHEMFRAELAAKRPGSAVGSTATAMSAQPVGVPLLALRRLRRGPPRAPERRRAHRARDRDVPRRLAPRGDRRRARRREPVRGRAGDDRAAARERVPACSARTPSSRTGLRAERDRVPNFVEEMLRFESPVKGDFRLARVATTVGGVDIPAGTTLMVLNGAANRDPRRFDRADEFLLDRANARQHIAFGHGVHTCPGAPLARAEARVSIERILDRMRDITISEAHHGPPGARRFDYAPTYILRGLNRLHLEFTPAG